MAYRVLANYAGRHIRAGDQQRDPCDLIPESGSLEAYTLTAEIMDIDLSDYGVCLTAEYSDEVPTVDKSSQESPPAHSYERKRFL